MENRNGKFFDAEDCRCAKMNHFTNLVKEEVERITDLCYEKACNGGTTYRVECGDTISPLNKEVIARLKVLGFKLIENSNRYYVISWEE